MVGPSPHYSALSVNCPATPSMHSLYLSTLYRTEVLGEWCSTEVPSSPYYNGTFFDILRHYHHNTNINVATMTIKSWTTTLTNDRVLLSPATDDVPASLLPIRVEVRHPTADWPLA